MVPELQNLSFGGLRLKQKLKFSQCVDIIYKFYIFKLNAGILSRSLAIAPWEKIPAFLIYTARKYIINYTPI